MRKQFLYLISFIVFSISLQSANATEAHATKDQAIAFVKKAIAFVKQSGKTQALIEFNKPQGQFVDHELYVAALDLNGVMLANGGNPKLVGKVLFDIKDVNGKYFVREEIDLAKTKGNGWVEFEWLNPVSKKMERRSAYLERIDDYIILSGIFSQ